MTAFSFLVQRKTECISVAALIFILTPFLVLSFFSHPSFIDDYCFATKTMEQGLINAFLEWYNGWTGRYSLCFIMSINPLVFHSFFMCQVLLFSLIALFPLLLFFLVKTILPNYHLSVYLSITALFTGLYFYQLPSVNEGLYWMTGAFAYQLPNVCLLLLLILLTKQYASSKKRILSLLSSVFLVIILVGTNEISMATFFVFMTLIFVRPIVTQKKIYNNLLLLLSITVICSLVVIYCPGNKSRGELFPLSHNVWQAVKMTVLGFGYYSLKWSIMTCITVTLLIYTISKEKMEQNKLKLYVPFKISLLFFLTILFIGFFVPAWATGQMPNPRAINVLYLIFLLGVFYHALFFIQVIDQYVKINKSLIWIVGVLILCLTTYSGKYWTNNIKDTYADLWSGRAYRYDKTMLTLYKTGQLHILAKEYIPLSIVTISQLQEASYKGCTEQYIQYYYKKIRNDSM